MTGNVMTHFDARWRDADFKPLFKSIIGCAIASTTVIGAILAFVHTNEGTEEIFKILAAIVGGIIGGVFAVGHTKKDEASSD